MTTFTVLGDTHLGRKFRTGVPLDRLGDREAMVWAQFEDELLTSPKQAIHIHMGDLFDKFVVPPEVVIDAAAIYKKAAKTYPDTTFVILEGNHDVSRDTLRRSSFDLFTALVAGAPNIMVVSETPVQFHGYGFVPYNAFTPTSDLVWELSDDLKAVFGHWDIQDWGGDNVIPTQLLAEKGITTAYSGHDHLRRDLTRHGVDIHVVGSMQPFTHAEDDTGQWYVTLGLDEIDGQCLRDKNVRVLLKEGEELPVDLECLSLTAKRVVSDEEIEIDTSDFDTFDLRTALMAAIDETVREDVMKVFDDAQAPVS